jgi:heme/copper-type cytochrome/quinol oxidase subunit 3
LQKIEYAESSFSFSDSVFGRVFFIATGFHGLHVIIGSILLFYSLMRILSYHFSLLNPIGFELSI